MRSGTTFFRNVISSNRNILSLGPELNNLWTNTGQAPCGLVPSNPPKTADDATDYIRMQVRTYFESHFNSKNTPKQIAYRAYRKIRFGNESIIKNGRPFYLLDKETQLLNKMPYLNEIFPDAKFIVLIRNIYSYTNSLKKHLERISRGKKFIVLSPESNEHGWRFIPIQQRSTILPEEKNEYTFAEIPKYWINQNLLLLDFLREQDKSRILYIHYQDIIEELPNVLFRVGEFLCLPNINRRIRTNLVNNQTNDPLNQWKQDLTNEQIAQIEHIVKSNEQRYQFICSFIRGKTIKKN